MDDFDFEKNCIYVSRNAIYDPIKKEIVEKDTKTENGERVVYLPQFVMDYAAEWFVEREKQIDVFVEREMRLRNVVYQAPDNIFLSRFGKIMFPDTAGEVWAHFRDKYKLSHVTPHGLRTTFATIQYQENKDLTERELALILGHAKDLKMTRHYTQEDESKIPNSALLFENRKSSNSSNETINKEPESSPFEIDYTKMENPSHVGFTFDQVVTIMTGNVYSNAQEMVELVQEYYQTTNDINYNEMPRLLYKIKKDLIFGDEKFKNIENYIQNSNDDWNMILEGEKQFGNYFQVRIEKNKRSKYNNYYQEIDKEEVELNY